MSRRQPSRRGFTLLELLVVLGILSVVTTIGISIFFRVTTSYGETERRMALNATAERIFDSLQQDGELITASTLCGTALHGVRAMEEQKRYDRVPLEDDRLVMPISDYNPLQKQVERATVMYRVNRDNGVPRLERVVQAGYRHDEPAGGVQVVADGVLSIRFEYFDGAAWQPVWDAKAHPKAVRCSVTVQDPDYPRDQISRCAAFALRVS